MPGFSLHLGTILLRHGARLSSLIPNFQNVARLFFVSFYSIIFRPLEHPVVFWIDVRQYRNIERMSCSTMSSNNERDERLAFQVLKISLTFFVSF
jgi:hypothetical protein